MKRLGFICLILLSSIWASKEARIGGFDGFVERMGASSRELARGNAGSSDTSSMPAAYWNPALLAFRKNIAYTLHAEKRALDRAGGSLGVDGRIGSRMGVGGAILYRGDFDFQVIDEDDQTLGSASPFFSMIYLGLAYRLSKRDALGLSFSMSYDNLDIAKHYDDIDLEDAYRSPVTFNFSWFRQVNEKWSVSVIVRNLSFGKNLSAEWTKTTSGDNSIESTGGFRPKTLQVGLGYRSKLLGRDASLWFEAIDYQMSKVFLAFDPDAHYWTARLGAEYEVIPSGALRAGVDGTNFSLGLGYRFEIRLGKKKWPFEVNYALLYESQADLWNPLSFGVRGWIP